MTPEFEILRGDCRQRLLEVGDAMVDAVITDPPYELGFMGKKWDASGIAYDVGVWREVLRVLKPGGHLLACGGTRTHHRQTCAIEDAGFEIRDELDWVYGTGFPKSLNLGDGRGTALKPAREPIVLARRPLAGTVAKTLAAHGTGALNIDACRIPYESPEAEAQARVPQPRFGVAGEAGVYNYKTGEGRSGEVFDPSRGRWPANVLLDEAAAEELGPSASFFYVAKPTRRERDLGLEAFSSRGGGEATDRDEGSAGLSSPRTGAGRTGGAKNYHPTVKPIALMRYLVRLITPPGGIVLDPFTGSGTTGMAAVLEGRDFLGVELDEDYAKIAEARITAASCIQEAA